MALHYVFDCPEDKLIWDVAHQVRRLAPRGPYRESRTARACGAARERGVCLQPRGKRLLCAGDSLTNLLDFLPPPPNRTSGLTGLPAQDLNGPARAHADPAAKGWPERLHEDEGVQVRFLTQTSLP